MGIPLSYQGVSLQVFQPVLDSDIRIYVNLPQTNLGTSNVPQDSLCILKYP